MHSKAQLFWERTFVFLAFDAFLSKYYFLKHFRLLSVTFTTSVTWSGFFLLDFVYLKF